MTELAGVGNSYNFNLKKAPSFQQASRKKIECLNSDGSATYLQQKFKC